jgi:hypothetical protein
MNLDIIGDIHGHANDLIDLLEVQLNYTRDGDTFTPPLETHALFLGDYIDRGTRGGQVIRIVRSMVDRGVAIALMGNHEYNAICYATLGPDGEPLRPHKPGNVKQHRAFTDEFQDDPSAYQEQIRWFRTLPLFTEVGDIRAVHAAWDPKFIRAAKQHEGLRDQWMSDAFIQQSAIGGTAEFKLIETLLKGPEHRLPESAYFEDKGGKLRKYARLRWWSTPKKVSDYFIMGHHGCTESPDLPGLTPPTGVLHLPSDAPPVFFGHYWFKELARSVGPNWACLDHSIAKNGKLSCYRYRSDSADKPLDWRHIVSSSVSPG